MALTLWPPRNSALVLCDFILPASSNDLKECIATAVASVDLNMLRCVWSGLDYMYYNTDICRVTKGSHIENSHLSRMNLETYT
jgi:hypothetical protein